LDAWYLNHPAFQLNLGALLHRLGIPPGALNARMFAWGSRNFDIDYGDPFVVDSLNSLRGGLQIAGALTSSGLVTPDTTPTNSPGRGGGGGGNV
jgi:hypothetical protein